MYSTQTLILCKIRWTIGLRQVDRNSKVFYLVMCERMICSPFIITTLTTKPFSISILLNQIFREILIHKNQNYVNNSSEKSIFQNQPEIIKTNGRLSWFSNHQYGKIIDTTVKHKQIKNLIITWNLTNTI